MSTTRLNKKLAKCRQHSLPPAPSSCLGDCKFLSRDLYELGKPRSDDERRGDKTLLVGVEFSLESGDALNDKDDPRLLPRDLEDNAIDDERCGELWRFRKLRGNVERNRLTRLTIWRWDRVSADNFVLRSDSSDTFVQKNRFKIVNAQNHGD